MNILNMFRSIISGVGLLIVSLVVNAELLGDKNEHKDLWSNFKFPDDAERFSR